MEFERFFGRRDAGQEDPSRLMDFFLPVDALGRLKTDEKSDGPCVVVGVKGSGKTAICRTIKHRNEDNAVVWLLELTDGFSVLDGQKSSTYYRSLLAVHLLAGMLSRVEQSKEDFSETARDALPGGIAKFKKTVEGALKKCSLTVGTSGIGLRLDLDDLLEEGQRALGKLRLDEFKEILGPCLKERRGYILIDEVDDIFDGSDVNYEFIEGLIAAAVEINNAFGNLLHCLVFLKAGAYSRFFEYGRNYDRYGDEAALVLRWDADSLTSMMARRANVAADLDATSEDVWETLGHVFAGKKKDVQAAMQFMIDRSNSGPRDLIIFGNLAKKAVGNSKIQLKHLVSEETRYSREKLYLLNRDYGRQHGKVSQLLSTVFRGAPAVYGRGELELLIQTKMLGNKDIVKGELGSMPLLLSLDALKILDYLFQFGFIGYREDEASDLRYMMDMEGDLVVPGGRLFSAYQHRIHPAYHAELMLATNNE